MLRLQVQSGIAVRFQIDCKWKQTATSQFLVEFEPRSWKQRLRVKNGIELSHPVRHLKVFFDNFGGFRLKTVNDVLKVVSSQLQLIQSLVETGNGEIPAPCEQRLMIHQEQTPIAFELHLLQAPGIVEFRRGSIPSKAACVDLER